MKYQHKVSGRKREWVEAAPEMLSEWKFERRPGGWVIASRTTDGRTERIRFFYERIRQQFWAKMNTQSFQSVDFYGERIPQVRTGAKGESASDFTAQFPGKVRKLLVSEGQQVEENAPLLMIEAMKMEFAIKAQNSGCVVKLWVAEGQVLVPGQKLLDFEDSKGETK